MMYSGEIGKKLKELGINPGDKIKVEYDNVEIEGELMPKTEFGSPDTIIVKLKNGYNVGIGFKNSRITKVSSGKGIPEFPKASMKPDPKLPKVSLIYTGGTIGSKIDYKTGGVEESKMSPEELLYIVPELSKIARIVIRNPFSIPSEEMSHSEWKTIANEVAKELNDGARGVVVTMGTDTMHYLSSALSFMLNNLNAPVVVTGAQRSSDRGSSDAFVNLICSVQIAAKSNIAEVGVCMHATSSDDQCHFIKGTKVRKMHSSRRDAFRPINDRAIAHVTKEGEIKYAENYSKISSKKTKLSAKTDFDSKIAIVKVFPGSDPTILDFYIDKGYDGFIIEATGLGHVPTNPSKKEYSWIPSIKKAIAKGAIVGITTQTLYGRVNPNVYTNLRIVSGTGAIYCEDMLPETAFVKLGWLLANYDKKKAKELLNKNLAGEINERINYDEFLL